MKITFEAPFDFMVCTIFPCLLISVIIPSTDWEGSEVGCSLDLGVGIPHRGNSTPAIFLYSSFKANRVLTASPISAFSHKKIVSYKNEES